MIVSEEPKPNYADDADTNDGRVITWGLQDIAERLDRLAEAKEAANEQAVIANLIALLRHCDDGKYDETLRRVATALGVEVDEGRPSHDRLRRSRGSGGANLPSLFAPPETDQGNMRVPEDIAAALGIDEMSMTNQLEELAKRATPGPWHWDEDERDLLSQSLELVWGTDGDPEIADAEFIAAANPQMVLTLIERVKTAEAALDAP